MVQRSIVVLCQILLQSKFLPPASKHKIRSCQSVLYIKLYHVGLIYLFMVDIIVMFETK